jgi:hypothetical protein
MAAVAGRVAAAISVAVILTRLKCSSDNNRRGNPFGQTSPEQDALQKAIDEDAPAAQIKDLLGKYQASQKAKQDKLLQAQADFRAVLTTKQEAQATLLGLLN